MSLFPITASRNFLKDCHLLGKDLAEVEDERARELVGKVTALKERLGQIKG
jgi:hypothetical protein